MKLLNSSDLPAYTVRYACDACKERKDKVIDMVEDDGDYYFTPTLVCKECLTKALALLN